MRTNLGRNCLRRYQPLTFRTKYPFQSVTGEGFTPFCNTCVFWSRRIHSILVLTNAPRNHTLHAYVTAPLMLMQIKSLTSCIPALSRIWNWVFRQLGSDQSLSEHAPRFLTNDYFAIDKESIKNALARPCFVLPGIHQKVVEVLCGGQCVTVDSCWF